MYFIDMVPIFLPHLPSNRGHDNALGAQYQCPISVSDQALDSGYSPWLIGPLGKDRGNHPVYVAVVLQDPSSEPSFSFSH